LLINLSDYQRYFSVISKIVSSVGSISIVCLISLSRYSSVKCISVTISFVVLVLSVLYLDKDIVVFRCISVTISFVVLVLVLYLDKDIVVFRCISVSSVIVLMVLVV
jgi:hypothetical protein